jgi:hypothetical protein
MKKALLALIILTFSSCAREEGCTDKNAKNYSSTADKDCNCCTYEGKYVFWYGKATADWLISNNISTLTYYVNGQISGSQNANLYWSGAPSCGQSASVTVTKNLGSSKSKSYLFQVKDQNYNVIWEGMADFEGNVCTKLELIL